MTLATAQAAKEKQAVPCLECQDGNCPVKGFLGVCGTSDCDNGVTCISARPGDKIDLSRFSADTVLRVTSGMLMQENILNDGRRHVAAFKALGDFCWPIAADQSDVRESYEAIQPSNICLISVDRFAEAAQGAPELVKDLYKAAKEEVARAQYQMLSLARSSAQERLASFLANLARRTGTRTERGIELKLSMRRERIADHLGMQPETISRLMSGFKKTGVIELPRPSLVIIPDIEALEAEARAAQ